MYGLFSKIYAHNFLDALVIAKFGVANLEIVDAGIIFDGQSHHLLNFSYAYELNYFIEYI